MSGTAQTTLDNQYKKPGRMDFQARCNYWQGRYDTEAKQLALLQKRLETIQRQIEKQIRTKTWASDQLNTAMEQWNEAEPDTDKDY